MAANDNINDINNKENLDKFQVYALPENMAYAYDHLKNNQISGSVERQVDPLTSELEGRTVYLVPGNATLKKPLPPKEGFNICFNEEMDEWEYVAITPSKDELSKKLLQEIQNSEESKNVNKLNELNSYLYNTDWYVVRMNETGTPMPEDISTKRSEAREEISRLRPIIESQKESLTAMYEEYNKLVDPEGIYNS